MYRHYKLKVVKISQRKCIIKGCNNLNFWTVSKYRCILHLTEKQKEKYKREHNLKGGYFVN